MKRAAEQKKKAEGAQFVRYFGPLLDALRALGGSGTPDEVVERIATALNILPTKFRTKFCLLAKHGSGIRSRGLDSTL